jgi:hypothetical protein
VLASLETKVTIDTFGTRLAWTITSPDLSLDLLSPAAGIS